MSWADFRLVQPKPKVDSRGLGMCSLWMNSRLRLSGPAMVRWQGGCHLRAAVEDKVEESVESYVSHVKQSTQHLEAIVFVSEYCNGSQRKELPVHSGLLGGLLIERGSVKVGERV